MGDTESGLLGHLRFLYGSEAAEKVLNDLLQLMRSFDERISARSAEPLTEKDAVLITYGDMVREPGCSSLASLGQFLVDHVADVINTVHILPFYPYSSDDGFSVIDYLEVDPALGDWSNLASLGGSFRLMFDAVLNHISAESEWFQGFRAGEKKYQGYFTVVEEGTDLTSVFRPRELPLLTETETTSGSSLVWTTFSADQIDLNFRNPAVLLAAIEVLLTYVVRGADVIRLDAIAFIWKQLDTSCIHLPETHRIIQLFRSVLDAVAPAVVIITETNVPHPENVSYFGDGSNEAHLVYNFALPPLTLHAFHTGDATALAGWAAGMEAPSEMTSFFNFLASHDGIGVGGGRGYLTEAEISALAESTEQLGGNVSYRTLPSGSRVPYELNINYMDALAEPSLTEPDELVVRRFLTSQAVMLAIQGVPGIYFHSMFGSHGWTEGVAETGAARTVNRQKLGRAQLERELASSDSRRALVLKGYRRLLAVRRSHDAFAPHAGQRIVDLDNRLFSVLRTGHGGSVLCLHNVSSEAVAVDVGDILAAKHPTDAISGNVCATRLELEPYQTMWLAGESR